MLSMFRVLCMQLLTLFYRSASVLMVMWTKCRPVLVCRAAGLLAQRPAVRQLLLTVVTGMFRTRLTSTEFTL